VYDEDPLRHNPRRGDLPGSNTWPASGVSTSAVRAGTHPLGAEAIVLSSQHPTCPTIRRLVALHTAKEFLAMAELFNLTIVAAVRRAPVSGAV
jgi:hypothetical protein